MHSVLRAYYPLIDKEQQATIRQVYDRWLAKPADQRASTALISIKNLMTNSNDFSADHLRDSAWGLYSADSVLEINKLPAFQILGDFGDYRILRESRQFLQDNSSDFAYKMSAMAILAKHGIVKDVSFIEPYAKHADLRLRTAANRNLKILKKRLAEQVKSTD